MARTIALVLVLLAGTSEARASDRTDPTRRLHLVTPEFFTLPESLPASVRQPSGLVADGMSDHEERESGLPPFFTLVAPQSAAPDESAGTKPPLIAFGARVQGRTLIVFTRSNTKIDPDDRVVYQRLVVSDLLQGRRFSVTVYEDHALGSSDSQILGFGARLMLRPALEIRGWRARAELFVSYDLTLGAMGALGITVRSPPPPRVSVP